MVDPTIKNMNKSSRLFTMRMKSNERKQYEDLAETHGFGNSPKIKTAYRQQNRMLRINLI